MGVLSMRLIKQLHNRSGIGFKLGILFVLIGVLMLGISVIGLIGIGRLSSALDFVTEKVWHAADGATDTQVELQRQMILVTRLTQGQAGVDDQPLIAASDESIQEALLRLSGSQLVAEELVSKLEQSWRSYALVRDRVVKAEQKFVKVDARLKQDFTRLERVLASVRSYTLKAIDHLKGGESLGLTLSDQVALEVFIKGETEKQRELARQWIYDYQNLVLSGYDEPAVKKGQNSLAKLADQIQRVSQHPIFDTRAENETLGQGTYGKIMSQVLAEHKANAAQALDAFRELQEARQAYEQQSEQMLGLLAQVEVENEGLIKKQDAHVESTKFAALTGMVISGVLGMLVSAGAIRFTRCAVVKPIRQVAETATAIADGDLNHLVNFSSSDEIGTLAQAFNRMTDKLRRQIEAEQQARREADQLAAVQTKTSQQTAELVEKERQSKEQLQRMLADYLEFIERVAEGDLSARLTLHEGDYLMTTLGHNLNIMVERLGEMTLQIREATENIAVAAAEILAATQQQAGGASEQSAAVAQTSITIDQVKTIVEQSFAKARLVAEQAQQTREISKVGQQTVVDTVDGMRQIKDQVESIAGNILALSEQTQQIGEIIATVNEIASQSKLLALNASVEAARAGEHGKGFAVVAVEVRNLAEQSRHATGQIKAILSKIQQATNRTVMSTEEGTKGVDSGVALTAQAGAAIQQLTESITASASAAQQIVASAQQQAVGVEQIALAIENINQATLQNIASTRQAEKAAEDLSGVAKQLKGFVARYKLN